MLAVGDLRRYIDGAFAALNAQIRFHQSIYMAEVSSLPMTFKTIMFFSRAVRLFVAVAIVAATSTCVLAAEGPAAATHTVQLNGHNFTLPDGFTIEQVAGPPLADRPIVADFDEQGRLYVADSSGSNEKVEIQLQKKPHRIVRLEDSDGDGRFDKSTVFATGMMFPEGTMWHGGSLYVAAPPSIWKLTDTDGDGVADQRVNGLPAKHSPVVPMIFMARTWGETAGFIGARAPLPSKPTSDLGGLPSSLAHRTSFAAARRHGNRAGDDRRHGQPGRRRVHADRRANLQLHISRTSRRR